MGLTYSKTRAAKLLAVGDTLAEVAKVVGKTETTLKRWMLEPTFRKILLDNMEGAALRVVQGYLSGEHDDKDRALAALALLRFVKAAKPGRPPKNQADDEDNEGLGEFSEEQLRRFTSD